VAVFFITGRTAKDRRNTALNLALQGMGKHEELITRPDCPKDPAADFKSARRREITARGFTIIANIGDQATDLEGCYAERGFKLPDPFYLIP
jgi:acid phosphatase